MAALVDIGIALLIFSIAFLIFGAAVKLIKGEKKDAP